MPAELQSSDRIFLSQADVERLLSDNSIDSRIDVVKKISGQYVGQSFSENELVYAEQIFRLLMRDTEMRVRQELARALQNADNAPRDVILALANDHERVAAPVIRSSDILSDADLLRIIENSHEIGKIEAVADRESVSERVSHALVETHYPQVVKSLLENPGARIAARDIDMIVDEHQQDRTITETLAKRPNLPVPIAEKLIHYVSEHLAQELKATYQIEVEEAAQQSQESMILQLVRHDASDESIEDTINQMRQFDRLTPSILLSALCQGNVRFFEIGLAKLAGIPKANARKLVRDKGAYGFEALYEKAGMPESLFDAVRLLLNAVLAIGNTPGMEPGSKLFTGMVIEQMTQQAQTHPVENLSYLIELVRRSMSP